MAILYRIIHKIDPNRWDEVVEWEKKYEAVESRYGAPPKRVYRPHHAPHDSDTVIVESEWESYSAMEEIYRNAYADPEFQKVHAEARGVFLTSQSETYGVLK